MVINSVGLRVWAIKLLSCREITKVYQSVNGGYCSRSVASWTRTAAGEFFICDDIYVFFTDFTTWIYSLESLFKLPGAWFKRWVSPKLHRARTKDVQGEDIHFETARFVKSCYLINFVLLFVFLWAIIRHGEKLLSSVFTAQEGEATAFLTRSAGPWVSLVIVLCKW